MIESRIASEDLSLPSNRNFGLTVGSIVFAIVTVRWWLGSGLDLLNTTLIAVSTPLLVLGVLCPRILELPNKLWMKLGQVMFRVVNPAIMLLMWGFTILPIGLAMRISGKDLMAMKINRDASTYWIDREKSLMVRDL